MPNYPSQNAPGFPFLYITPISTSQTLPTFPLCFASLSSAMTAPNIEMIEASLRNCSLDGSPPATPARTPAPARPVEMTVELNSEVALPYYWEQCLDMRTGEIYYINWKDGTRTTEDPRLCSHGYNHSYYSEESEDSYDDENSTSDDNEDYECIECQYTPVDDSATSSSSSSQSTTSPSEPAAEILVAAGCKACFMYFMVPKRDFGCPKCGRLLLHLGRNGCF